MSLEDMISHFGYCNGDGSFAKFECPHCQGRVTSEEILKKHIKRSHNNKKISNGENNEETTELNDEIKKNVQDCLPENNLNPNSNVSKKQSKHLL